LISRICPYYWSKEFYSEILGNGSLQEKLFRNQVGGEEGTVPELLFEKKGLIPAIQQLIVSKQNIAI
jgi:hypothetical protein